MLKYVFHSLLLVSLVFGFAACEKESTKNRTKAARGKGTAGKDGTQIKADIESQDNLLKQHTFLPIAAEGVEQISAVYSEILSKVIREEKSSAKTITPLRIAQDVLKKILSEKTKRVWVKGTKITNVIGLEASIGGKLYRFALTLPEGNESMDLFLVQGFEVEAIDDGIGLVSIVPKDKGVFELHVVTNAFATMVPDGDMLSIQKNSKCDFLVDLNNKAKLKELVCDELVFIKNSSELVLLEDLKLSQGDELKLSAKGFKYTGGTKGDEIELNIEEKIKTINYTETSLIDVREVSKEKSIEPGLDVRELKDDSRENDNSSETGDKPKSDDRDEQKDEQVTEEQSEEEKLKKEVESLSSDDKLVADENGDKKITQEELAKFNDEVEKITEEYKKQATEDLQKSLESYEQELKNAQNEEEAARVKLEIGLIQKELESRNVTK